jgi:hypothetical protein
VCENFISQHFHVERKENDSNEFLRRKKIISLFINLFGRSTERQIDIKTERQNTKKTERH